MPSPCIHTDIASDFGMNVKIKNCCLVPLVQHFFKTKARKEIEQKGGTVISSKNAKQLGVKKEQKQITKNVTPKKKK
jgi:hypothetical protein